MIDILIKNLKLYFKNSPMAIKIKNYIACMKVSQKNYIQYIFLSQSSLQYFIKQCFQHLT